MTIQAQPSVSSIRYLRGVGPKRALALEKLGIHSVRDLLYFFPRRYEDRSRFIPIMELVPGQSATLRAEILSVQLKPLKRMPLVEMMVGDKSGAIHAIWFNQPYLKNQFAVGQEIILHGKMDLYQKRMQMMSPEYEILDPEEEAIHTGRITPVYPLTEGLFQRSLRSTLREIIQTQLDKTLSDYLPQSFRREKNLEELRDSVREMHFPTSFERLESARRRIVFDEFFLFEITLLQKMEQMKNRYQARVLKGNKSSVTDFEKSLPFRLTAGQKKALGDLAEEVAQPSPMNRLLQGEVGSGKTVVATYGLLLSAQNHFQGAFLVPTEILAEQHYRTLKNILKPFALDIGLLTASTPNSRRERMLADLKQGRLPIVIGTHALLNEEVKFAKLAFVVIDEQHKFGVYQRCRLLQTEPRPHQLVMTATPIPRTLALTLYGDLQVSTLKELPAGRKPIATYWVTRSKQSEILAHILEKVRKGEQAYFIFPIIEETERSDLLAAKRAFEELRRGAFSSVKMGLVHGRLSREACETTMQAFRRNDIQILLATSVVEVGVDNPNATVMVIENAERFGLSQLHQMRGRIGRGSKPSECFLFGEPKTLEGQKRLRILTKTQNGFLIAEEDLKLRGPGDFWGSRQSGEPLFRTADPIQDYPLLLEAREAALHLVKNRLLDQSPEWVGVKNFLAQFPLRY